MKPFLKSWGIWWLLLPVVFSCSKEEASAIDQLEESTFLQFKTEKGKNAETIYYTDWLKSGFPNSSQAVSETWDLPLIKEEYFDPAKDLIMVYGQRNIIYTLPATLPQDVESYLAELIPLTNGTLTRIRVTSLNLNPLQDIFFRSSAGATFRVVIIPSQKLLDLKSHNSKTFEKMSYNELAAYFGLTN